MLIFAVCIALFCSEASCMVSKKASDGFEIFGASATSMRALVSTRGLTDEEFLSSYGPAGVDVDEIRKHSDPAAQAFAIGRACIRTSDALRRADSFRGVMLNLLNDMVLDVNRGGVRGAGEFTVTADELAALQDKTVKFLQEKRGQNPLVFFQEIQQWRANLLQGLPNTENLQSVVASAGGALDTVWEAYRQQEIITPPNPQHPRLWLQPALISAGTGFARMIDRLHKCSDLPAKYMAKKIIVSEISRYVQELREMSFLIAGGGKVDFDPTARIKKLACDLSGLRNHFDIIVFLSEAIKEQSDINETYEKTEVFPREAGDRKKLLKRIDDNIPSDYMQKIVFDLIIPGLSDDALKDINVWAGNKVNKVNESYKPLVDRAIGIWQSRSEAAVAGTDVQERSVTGTRSMQPPKSRGMTSRGAAKAALPSSVVYDVRSGSPSKKGAAAASSFFHSSPPDSPPQVFGRSDPEEKVVLKITGKRFPASPRVQQRGAVNPPASTEQKPKVNLPAPTAAAVPQQNDEVRPPKTSQPEVRHFPTVETGNYIIRHDVVRSRDKVFNGSAARSPQGKGENPEGKERTLEKEDWTFSKIVSVAASRLGIPA